MTQEEFEAYISPVYLTFKTFKQAIKNSPVTSQLNVDTAIVDEVLTFDDNSPNYPLLFNYVAILINCSNNNTKGVYSSTLSTNTNIFPQNTYPGAIFIKGIFPPLFPPSEVDMYTFLIVRFD